jgi:hypothetical protein
MYACKRYAVILKGSGGGEYIQIEKRPFFHMASGCFGFTGFFDKYTFDGFD